MKWGEETLESSVLRGSEEKEKAKEKNTEERFGFGAGFSQIESARIFMKVPLEFVK